MEVLPARVLDGLQVVEGLAAALSMSVKQESVLHSTYRTAPTHNLSAFGIVLIPTFAVSAPDAASVPCVDVIVEGFGNVLLHFEGADTIALHLLRSFDDIVKLRFEAWNDLLVFKSVAAIEYAGSVHYNLPFHCIDCLEAHS